MLLTALLLTCNITVWIPVVDDKNNNKVLFYISSKDNLEGKLISENSEKYLIDFSKDATAKGYEGEKYKQVSVEKKECFKK